MHHVKLHRWVVSILTVIVLCAAVYFATPRVRESTIDVLEWLDGIGNWAPIAYVAITVAGVVLILPGFLFSLGAGFIFGLVQGVALVWVAINLGALLAFLVGRHAIGKKFISLLNRHDRIEQINEVLLHKGWKTIMFTRMIPFFPFKLSNYVFGMAGYSIKDFWLGTAIGILPITIFNVYMGSMAGALTELGVGNQPVGALQWAIYVFGFIFLCWGMIYLARIGRKTLRLDERSTEKDKI